MGRQFFNEIAGAAEPGARDLLGAQSQMFEPDDVFGALAEPGQYSSKPDFRPFSIYEQINIRTDCSYIHKLGRV